MRKSLLLVGIISALMMGCATTSKQVEPSRAPEVEAFEAPAETQVAALGPQFTLDDGTKIDALSGQTAIGDWIYAAGSAKLSTTQSSLNSARARAMANIASFVNTSVETAMQDYLNDAGIQNSDTLQDTQAVVANSMGTFITSEARFSGIEYVQTLKDTEGTVYVLARLQKDNINKVLQDKAVELTRKDAAVKANKEATDFFNNMISTGVFH
jgi:hypothetical protein